MRSWIGRCREGCAVFGAAIVVALGLHCCARLSALTPLLLRAERLDRVRSYEDRIRAITPEMLQQAALRYLDPAQELRIRIVHESLVDAE